MPGLGRGLEGGQVSEVSEYFPSRLYAAGITDLISVVPPDGVLSPLSKIAPATRGKTPGRLNSSGLWAGYDWRRAEHTAAEIAAWESIGANVGLLAKNYPAVDIDCTDPSLAQMIADLALMKLGPAPIRTGNPPKVLLPYRTDEPFGRMRVTFSRGEKRYLVEVLGDGQQYLIHGIHPNTKKPYTWSADLAAYPLTSITREQAHSFIAETAEVLRMLGYDSIKTHGDGKVRDGAVVIQRELAAPSMEALADVVAAIPNNDDVFPDREDYLKIGYAIKAAGQEDEDMALSLFCGWAGRHTGGDRVEGNPETPINDWRRMNGPYAVGWSWLCEQAKLFGYNAAQHDFDEIEEILTSQAPPPKAAVAAAGHNQQLSDRWLEELVVAARSGELRYAPEMDRWYVWTGHVWEPDAVLLAEEVIKRELTRIAGWVSEWGGSEKEIAQAKSEARKIESAAKARDIRVLMQSNSGIAIRAKLLDADPWLLNTPAGVVELKTGKLRPASADDLCSRSTAVGPKAGPAPVWEAFLEEATQGDSELIAFLQRLAGYSLTGITREQQLTFFWGPGGNGKGTFVNTIYNILADYSVEAAMETFTANTGSRHPTELAMLAGARMVKASETESGKRWAEARVKAMTGEDNITAHFMRQDDFTFKPQFKLYFLGNHKPEIRNIDDAIRRRFHLVPFTVTPKLVDQHLAEKLEQEYPQILAWMIEGALAWQEQGLSPPPVVKAATEEYFAEENPIARWLAARCIREGTTLLTELYQDWREWANSTGEYDGTIRRLNQSLKAMHFEPSVDEENRPCFEGISLKPKLLGL